MQLRHRLLVFSAGPLVVFGSLFAIAFWWFERSVVPAFETLLTERSIGITADLARDLDVPLGADDRKLLDQQLDRIALDSDVRAVVVRDDHDKIVTSTGTAPDDVFAGPASTVEVRAGGIWSWAPVSLEGLRLGSVAVVLDTARFTRIEQWARRIAIGVALLWVGALAYSIRFARSFVTPIRAMMDFSRKVAGGALADRLAIHASGELRELRDYLNQMTAELERREQAQRAAALHEEAMQRELVAVSRMAGMTEVATGVLHNVGNVLNSLNVSVSMIGDRVRGSRVAALAKSVELFDAFPGGLPAFLATEKGRILPGYLCSVAKKLVDDNASLLHELGSMTHNVEHIKSIVAMQQTYASTSFVSEPIALDELVDDALRMVETSFAKHGIEIVRDYEATTVITDRNKVLQILINIIANARHALKHDPDGVHRLTVTVRPTEAGASIAIADSGIGIAAEIIGKIFQHGFTTKEHGHGFGLHASANAARELGGSLGVASGGLGTGATFTLLLPATSRSPHDN